MKGLLRGLVQDMQARAKEGTTRNGTTDNTGTNGQVKVFKRIKMVLIKKWRKVKNDCFQNNTVRRTPPVKNGDMNGQVNTSFPQIISHE